MSKICGIHKRNRKFLKLELRNDDEKMMLMSKICGIHKRNRKFLKLELRNDDEKMMLA